MDDVAAASIKLVTWNKDVYEPSDDSFALVDAVHSQLTALIEQSPKLALEIGCGSGYVICSFALALRQAGLHCCLLGTDINPKALEATAATLQAHQVTNVDLLQTDLLGGLMPQLQGQVDVLLFNPPYVPSPDDELLGNGISRAWAGGERGRRIIDRLLLQLEDILAPGGQLFMVTVTENDPAGIIQQLQSKGFNGRVVLTRGADEELLQIVHIIKERKVMLTADSCPAAQQA